MRAILPQPAAVGHNTWCGTYVGAQPKEALGIPGVEVTHVWCDDPADAVKVANAACIAHVVQRPEDVIGHVDAAVIPTDRGWEHVDRARPFIDAGLPLFIDKPLVDRVDHLRQFVAWHREGRAFLSTSCTRCAKKSTLLRERLGEIGRLRLVTMTTAKSWERYGIHALEGVYGFLAPGGWLSVTNSGTAEANIVHVRHRDGVDVVLAAIADLAGAFGCLSLYGTRGASSARFEDTFSAFKSQLAAFVEHLRSGRPAVEFSETAELMKILIAGIRSREESGRRVRRDEIQ